MEASGPYSYHEEDVGGGEPSGFSGQIVTAPSPAPFPAHDRENAESETWHSGGVPPGEADEDPGALSVDEAFGERVETPGGENNGLFEEHDFGADRDGTDDHETTLTQTRANEEEAHERSIDEDTGLHEEHGERHDQTSPRLDHAQRQQQHAEHGRERDYHQDGGDGGEDRRSSARGAKRKSLSTDKGKATEATRGPRAKGKSREQPAGVVAAAPAPSSSATAALSEPSTITPEAAPQLKAPAFLIKLYNILCDPDPQVKSLIHWAPIEAVEAQARAAQIAQEELERSEIRSKPQASEQQQQQDQQQQDERSRDEEARGDDLVQDAARKAAAAQGQAGPSSVVLETDQDKRHPSAEVREDVTRPSLDGHDFFVVEDAGDFAKVVLPRYFKHNNWQSFVRQLNMYDFRKLNDFSHGSPRRGSLAWHFRHRFFQRGRPGELRRIERKPAGSAAAAAAAVAAAMAAGSGEGRLAGAKTRRSIVEAGADKAAAVATAPASLGSGAHAAGSMNGKHVSDGSAGVIDPATVTLLVAKVEEANASAASASAAAASAEQQVQVLRRQLDEQAASSRELKSQIAALWQIMSGQAGYTADALESLATAGAAGNAQTNERYDVAGEEADAAEQYEEPVDEMHEVVQGERDVSIDAPMHGAYRTQDNLASARRSASSLRNLMAFMLGAVQVQSGSGAGNGAGQNGGSDPSGSNASVVNQIDRHDGGATSVAVEDIGVTSDAEGNEGEMSGADPSAAPYGVDSGHFGANGDAQSTEDQANGQEGHAHAHRNSMAPTPPLPPPPPPPSKRDSRATAGGHSTVRATKRRKRQHDVVGDKRRASNVNGGAATSSASSSAPTLPPPPPPPPPAQTPATLQELLSQAESMAAEMAAQAAAAVEAEAEAGAQRGSARTAATTEDVDVGMGGRGDEDRDLGHAGEARSDGGTEAPTGAVHENQGAESHADGFTDAERHGVGAADAEMHGAEEGTIGERHGGSSDLASPSFLPPPPPSSSTTAEVATKAAAADGVAQIDPAITASSAAAGVGAADAGTAHCGTDAHDARNRQAHDESVGHDQDALDGGADHGEAPAAAEDGVEGIRQHHDYENL